MDSLLNEVTDRQVFAGGTNPSRKAAIAPLGQAKQPRPGATGHE